MIQGWEFFQGRSVLRFEEEAEAAGFVEGGNTILEKAPITELEFRDHPRVVGA